MADSTSFESDAGIRDVINLFKQVGECTALSVDEDDDLTFRFGTPGGAYVTAFWDLKPDIDEYETVVDVYEQSDKGAASRLFEYVAAAFDDKAVLRAPDSAEVIARASGGHIVWENNTSNGLN